jgi:ribosomal protein S14
MARYRPSKKTTTYLPLTKFVNRAPLPKKALKQLGRAKATYKGTMQCGICGEETLRIYKVAPPRRGGFMVCENPNCEAFGVVIPV